jgi:hypothetical protein
MSALGTQETSPLRNSRPESRHRREPIRQIYVSAQLHGLTFSPLRHRHLLPDPVKQLKHRQSKCIGNDLNGIERGIGPAILNPTQVRLVEAAPFPEHDLALAGL